MSEASFYTCTKPPMVHSRYLLNIVDNELLRFRIVLKQDFLSSVYKDEQ